MWDIESIAAGIQECVGPNGLDWESVLGRLDRPGFFVADSRGVDAIAELYNRCTSISTSSTNTRSTTTNITATAGPLLFALRGGGGSLRGYQLILFVLGTR